MLISDAHGFLTLTAPRVTPPGGLGGFDFLLMCGLPIGAFVAGKRWYSGPVFLLYGSLGMLTFIPGYLADGRLGLKFVYQPSSLNVDLVAWALGVLFVAIVCKVSGRFGWESAASSAAGEHEP